jgi:flavorubredoxin
MIYFIRPYYDFDSNVYLLTGDRNILIDTGTGLSSDYLINSVRSIIGKDGVLD